MNLLEAIRKNFRWVIGQSFVTHYSEETNLAEKSSNTPADLKPAVEKDELFRKHFQRTLTAMRESDLPIDVETLEKTFRGYWDESPMEKTPRLKLPQTEEEEIFGEDDDENDGDMSLTSKKLTLDALAVLETLGLED